MVTKEEFMELINKSGQITCSDESQILGSKDDTNKYICKFRADNNNKYFLKLYDTETYRFVKKVYERITELPINSMPMVHYKGSCDKGYYIIEEFIDGKSLKERMDSKCDSILDIIRIIKQICDAVRPLHKEIKPAIIHCDLSPNNILIETDETIRIIDLDAAFVEGSSENYTPRGTKGYMAGEVADGEPSTQSDIYSIGKILKNWYQNRNTIESIDPKSNAELKKIIKKCTCEIHEGDFENAGDFENERYSDIDELKAALVNAEILITLNKNIMDFRNSDSNINVYTYDSDTQQKLDNLSRNIKDVFNNDEIKALYAVHDLKRECLLVFTMNAMYSIVKEDLPHKILNFRKDDTHNIKKIEFDNIIAFMDAKDILTEPELNAKKTHHNIAVAVSSLPDKKNIGYDKLDLAYFDITSLCKVIQEIIKCREGLYKSENLAEYYIQKCNDAYTSLSTKEASDLTKWWNIVITLGKISRKTCEVAKKIPVCNAILKEIYENKINDAQNNANSSNGKEKKLLEQQIDAWKKEISKCKPDEFSEESGNQEDSKNQEVPNDQEDPKDQKAPNGQEDPMDHEAPNGQENPTDQNASNANLDVKDKSANKKKILRRKNK